MSTTTGWWRRFVNSKDLECRNCDSTNNVKPRPEIDGDNLCDCCAGVECPDCGAPVRYNEGAEWYEHSEPGTPACFMYVACPTEANS